MTSTSHLIIGAPKTGTTALYRAMRDAGDFLSIMEISNAQQAEYLLQRTDVDRLAKILAPKVEQIDLPLEPWSDVVLIVRDPRDVVISWLLYRPLLHGNFQNEEYIEGFVELLRRKEADPRSISVRELFEFGEEHDVGWLRPGSYRRDFRREERILDRRPDAFVIRYEDFIRGMTDELSEAVGLRVPGPPSALGQHNAENHRRGGSGAWRHWFTEQDVEEHREFFDPYLEKHGYDRTWDLADVPTIDPAVSSEHIRRNADRLRAGSRPGAELVDREAYDDERLAMLRDAIRDGRESAMIELALAHREGWGVEQDLSETIALLRDASARGNGNATVHLGWATHFGVGVERDEDAARDLFADSVALMSSRRASRLRAEHRDGWERMATEG